MRETDTHIYFWGTYMSNFYWSPTIFYEFKFPTSEHIYMALKAAYFDDEESFINISLAPDAKAAKALGRKVVGFNEDEWYKVSYHYMKQSVLAKFKQNIFIREKLIDTKDKTLVEASPYDKIWGVGLHFDDDKILDENNWIGENRLGKVLMEVRKELGG